MAPPDDDPSAALPANNLAEAVRLYLARGMRVVPLKPREKQPLNERGWQKKTYQLGDFRADNNIGIMLGRASGDLIDLDLDVGEARLLAPLFFSQSPTFGRPSAPGAHRLFHIPDHPGKVVKLYVANKEAAKRLLGMEPGTDDKCVVLELRAGGQTMFPPSVHPCGEIVEWVETGPTIPPTVGWEVLRRQAGVLALLAVMLRGYPSVPGARDEICLAAAGTLLRLGLSEAETDRLVIAVARAAGDEEANDRNKASATRAKMEAGEAVTGLPKLLELLGLGEIAKDIHRWLGESAVIEPGAILMRDGALIEIVDQAEASLLAGGVPIFQRGGELVRVTRLNKGGANESRE